VIVASNGGSPTHPDWYHNLRAYPKVTVELGAQTYTMLAEELGPSARADLWPQLVADSAALGDYQARTTRQIPVLMLQPLPD
jgi:deazaflavin-dependent oxidoreductase (nitroreductase family)